MKIQEIISFDSKILETINKFIIQLTLHKKQVNHSHVEDIISDKNSHLFFAINDQGEYFGMITVGFYLSPTGKKAWIEDVVVDDSHRGKGIGKNLVEFAIQFAKEQNAETLMLTSNPTRIIANQLYQRLGFQQKETNVYLLQL
jgi:GNAT superfamily N-acetyltransferase